MLAITTYLLQLANLYLLFKLVFGYDFRKNRYILSLGVLLILISLLARLGLWSSIHSVVQLLVIKGVIIVLPIVFFAGSFLRLFLLGLNYTLVVVFVFSAVNIAIKTFEIANLNAGIAAQLLLSVIFTGIILFLQSRKITLSLYAERTNPLLLTVTAIGLLLLNWNGGVVSTRYRDSMEVLIGKTQFFTVLIAFMILVVMILVQILILQRQQLLKLNLFNQKCIADQTLQYQRLEEKDAKLRAFKHDSRAHLAMIRAYLQEGNMEAAKTYVGQIEYIENAYSLYSSGNFILDAIVNQYKELGEQENLKIDVLGQMPKDITIAETDLCILLSNAISNAYEATVQCVEERNIRMQIMNNEGYLFIEIINPTLNQIEPLGKGLQTSKNKDLHGIGTRNMIETAEKYDGTVRWVFEDGWITTKVKLKYK